MPRTRILPTILTAAVLAAACATPALAASGSVALPEPSAMLLFGLGVAGVAIGRRFSSKRPRD
ncbi:PEP-CTERM sorting domain-containing protein [Novosphingobium sp. 9U]|uniref:PEP-CTERM sorting domain-containing protein n=1 Tax=Novosphingobium sp. 9U TaxID=2653158 RepID=UPI0012F465FB|nr:PEP-CTERM sorting domain-containing protein [Novosphingobium sp. 9U]VWX46904.1 Glycosyl transferase family 1 [Novosphingobium sp. 9U]